MKIKFKIFTHTFPLLPSYHQHNWYILNWIRTFEPSWASKLLSYQTKVVTDSTLGILTQRRQESSVKPELLIPTMLPSGQFLKTRGDFLHANACLDPCRVIDAWPLLYRALRLLITPARLSLLRCEWGRSRGGSHRSVNTRIFDCCSVGSAKTLFFTTTKVALLNVQKGWSEHVNVQFWNSLLKTCKVILSVFHIVLFLQGLWNSGCKERFIYC